MQLEFYFPNLCASLGSDLDRRASLDRLNLHDVLLVLFGGISRSIGSISWPSYAKSVLHDRYIDVRGLHSLPFQGYLLL